MTSPLHDWLARYNRLELLCHTKGAHLRAYCDLCRDAAELFADQIKGGAECSDQDKRQITSRKKVMK